MKNLRRTASRYTAAIGEANIDVVCGVWSDGVGEITRSFDRRINNLGTAFTGASKDLLIPVDDKVLSGWFACIGFDDRRCNATDEGEDQLAIEGNDIGLWDWLVRRYAGSRSSLLIHCTDRRCNGARVGSSVVREDFVRRLDDSS